MIVARTFDDLEGVLTSSCLTIGNFDGVHLAHQKLLHRVRERAKVLNAVSLAVTFEPHPRRVLLGKEAPPRLTTPDVKLELIAECGIEACLVLPFTRAFAALEPEEFVRDCLVRDLGMKELIIGHDWAFGKGRSGDYATLGKLGRSMGFLLERLGPVMVEDAVVSSTRIRDMLLSGDVWDVKPLLGRFHKVRGEVIHGADRGGKLLGFPTANVDARDQLLPKSGVYAVWLSKGEQTWAGVANIGTNPTFGGDHLSLEAHIFDYCGDLYGKSVDLHFVQRLRSEKKFSGIEELKARITEDAALARRILEEPEAGL
ncbi:bifunctional riboflavin kinase/FAD synthetase [Fundidesulfovibrio putealis]|uniref:bifunctional riboflavin kinase/FAD synthetase n=1 Tax=Fundidesulfovibrio putealis TaxID=270496 RepID=UPI00040B02E8|nr:bifunctional riboflavin kinase/FAD synthetase [Fundidesulfovibrio putealis]